MIHGAGGQDRVSIRVVQLNPGWFHAWGACPEGEILVGFDAGRERLRHLDRGRSGAAQDQKHHEAGGETLYSKGSLALHCNPPALLLREKGFRRMPRSATDKSLYFTIQRIATIQKSAPGDRGKD
jgi:hypothetical protein